jgi:hypothetical protein
MCWGGDSGVTCRVQLHLLNLHRHSLSLVLSGTAAAQVVPAVRFGLEGNCSVSCHSCFVTATLDCNSAHSLPTLLLYWDWLVATVLGLSALFKVCGFLLVVEFWWG